MTRKLEPVGLDRNELPYPPADSVVAAGVHGVLQCRRYPSWDASELREALARQYEVDPDWVVAASGSISVIQQAILAAGVGELLLCWPSFDAFPPLGTALRMRLRLAGVRVDGSCDLPDMLTKITHRTRLIIVCTPNTPTGGAVRHGELAEFVAGVPDTVRVLIDEAYAEFVDMDDPVRAVDLVRDHANAMMTRTFSKAYGLAGLRVGYGIAQPGHADSVARTGVPFALTRPAEDAALAALRRRDHMRAGVRRVNAERMRLAHGLEHLGVPVLAGQGNFVWVPIAGDVEPVATLLAESGLLVKTYPAYGIRISVGTPAQTDRLLSAWPKTVGDLQYA